MRLLLDGQESIAECALKESNKEMETTADVVIVGGGIIGVSVAYYLGKKGACNVLLLEKDRIGGRNGTLCRWN